MVSLQFFIDTILPTCKRNGYQEFFLGIRGDRCVGRTTLLPSCTDYLEIWVSEPPGIPRACPGLYRDCFTLFLWPCYVQNAVKRSWYAYIMRQFLRHACSACSLMEQLQANTCVTMGVQGDGSVFGGRGGGSLGNPFAFFFFLFFLLTDPAGTWLLKFLNSF